MSSSNLEKDQIKLIHHSAVLINGRKVFGKYDKLVETGSSTISLTYNPGKPETAIVLAAMERPERLRETFTRILEATRILNIATRILIMDNSIRDGLKEQVFSWSRKTVSGAVESIIYYHNPRMTQTTGRNIAVRNLIGDAEDVIFWDGDIYCGNRSVASLRSEWERNQYLMAIAPALIGYVSGDIDHRISEFFDITTNPKTREKTHMPGKIGEEIWVRKGSLMRATMMRGVFWVKRSLIGAVALTNPGGEPWLQDFVSLNNVAFFVAARELGYDFAYLLNPDTIVAHDDNIDEYSVGFKLPMRETQTLMEITALMVRNRVFTPEARSINPRFLKFNISEISRATGTDEITAQLIQEQLLKLAKLVGESRDRKDLISGYPQIRENLPPTTLNVVDRVFKRIYSDESYERIKELKSIKPSRMIYSVED